MAQAGWAVSVYGLGSIAGAYLGSKVSDRFGFYPLSSQLFSSAELFYTIGEKWNRIHLYSSALFP